jgi:hypothetical protein
MNDLKDEERQRCEIWTRVMGYHRPVSHWNTGKQQEYEDRARMFREKASDTETLCEMCWPDDGD